jgi:hypothetical protein
MKSKTDWKRIENMKDEDIDYSDIPELDNEFFEKGQVVIPLKCEYNPDYHVHPGEILKEHLEARNITHDEFIQLTASKEDITKPIARQLEEALGVSASLWLNLQRNYND